MNTLKKKYKRSDIFISKNDYDEIKKFFKGDCSFSSLKTHFMSVSDSEFITELHLSKVSFKQLSCKITVRTNSNQTASIDITVDKISKLLGIFEVSLNNYLSIMVNVSKVIDDSLESKINKLNLINWGCRFKDDYAKNYILYTGMNTEEDLVYAIYCLLHNVDNVRTLNIIDFIKDKFTYYGYDEDYLYDIWSEEKANPSNCETKEDYLRHLFHGLYDYLYDRNSFNFDGCEEEVAKLAYENTSNYLKASYSI